MDRDELHELVMSLKEKFDAGGLVLRDPHTIRELSEIRFAEDGKVDPASVGSRVRATAYASAAADASRAMRQTSLQEVQNRYFEIVDQNFGSLYSGMKRRELNPQQAANSLASQDGAVNAFMSDLEDLLPVWQTFGTFTVLSSSCICGSDIP